MNFEFLSSTQFDPSPLHHTFLLGHARFIAQPFPALIITDDTSRVLEMLDEADNENEEISSHKESILDQQLANESDETR